MATRPPEWILSGQNKPSFDLTTRVLDLGFTTEARREAPNALAAGLETAAIAAVKRKFPYAGNQFGKLVLPANRFGGNEGL
jgi:hypothetical protein